MVRKLFIILLSLSMVVGCASKRYTKKAQEFESAGYYEKAAEMYYTAVIKNHKNVDAQIGLRKTAQLTLNKKLADFRNYYNDDAIKDAVYKYQEALKYNQKIKAAGTELNFPKSNEDYYEEVKSIYLEQKYQESVLLLEEEEFSEAEVIFNEILVLAPEYQDVKDLKRIAKFEPIYRKGKDHALNEQYRKAYYAFTKILNETEYKDSHDLQADALERATLTIALLPFKNQSKQRGEEHNIQKSVQASLINSSSPFIKVIDRETSNVIKEEQLRTLEGKVDDKISAQAGKTLGVKSFLTGSIDKYTGYSSPLKVENKRGYLKVKIVEEKDGEKKTRYEYHKVTYKVYRQSRRMNCTFSFKLISAETGAIELSESRNISKSDALYYAVYQGKKEDLVPGYWKYKGKDSPEDEILDNYSAKKELKNLFRAKKSLKSIGDLKQEITRDISQFVTKKIEVYDPEEN